MPSSAAVSWPPTTLVPSFMHPLMQVRNAMAVAQALGRTLVLPELWCGLDRWWAPHSGVIPGSATTLPFRCPLDHVLDLEQ